MPERAAADRGYAWVVVAVSLYTVAVSMLVRFLFPVLLVLFLREYGWSRTVLSGVFSLHLLAYGVAAPWAGAAIDRCNRRRLLGAGGVGLATTLALLPLAASPVVLYLVYGVLGGLATSMLGLVPHTRIVAQWFGRRRGLALGLMVSGVGVGMAVVPLVQRALAALGWRAALFVLAALVVATVCPLTALGQAEPPVLARAPGLPASLRESLREPAFRGVAVGFACFGCFSHLVVAHEVALLVDLGYTARAAGFSLAVIGALTAIGNVLWGGVADRRGPRTAVAAAFTACLASVLVLLALGRDSAWPLVAAQLLLFGLGFGTPTALSALAAQRFGGERFGSAFGLVTLVFSVGGVVGPVLAGAVHDRLGSYRWAFAAAAAIVVYGGVAAWRGAARRAPA